MAILVRRLSGELLLVTLDRPEKRNALTLALIEELAQTLRAADRDSAVRGIVLAGAGPTFCGGVDLHEFADGSAASVRTLIGALEQVCSIVRTMPVPIACAIQGHCLGGALELAACCDFRVSTPSALLGMPEVFLGIPSVIDAVMLGQHVGAGRARELLLTGESISGETAFQWGLVNCLAPADGLIDAATELLGRVTRHAPEVIAAQKALHQEWLDLPYSAAVERSIEPLIARFRTGEPQRIATERLRKPLQG
jgi:enoyl-CoA hydratase/carnithine racemase